jgi:hypothetical protein
MPDIQAQIEQAKAQLERATEDLRIWESFEAVTATDEATGKVINVRSQMIAHCKHTMKKYREIVAALERKAESPDST